MKKNYISLFLQLAFIFLISLIKNNSFAEERESLAQNPVLATQKESFVLPPVRRIGLELVQTNIDEFRNFMAKQDRLLHGLVALPFNEREINHKLANDLEQQTKNTGRFWELSFSSFLNVLSVQNQKNMASKIENLKLKLELDYNLDAWIKPTVYFSPDQTLVRLSLHGSGSNQKTSWAREDILLEAQADEEKITKAFAQGLSRLISTLGHDGRITYSRDNLATIDFGSERGLIRGQKILAGYVVLTHFHPQSGEFLRAQRIPLYELKVLQVSQNSSLCQITAIDKVKLDQLNKSLPATTLITLAWRDTPIEQKRGWHEPYDPQTAPILGAAQSGFGVPVEEKPLPELPNNMIEPPQTTKKVALKSSQPEGTNPQSSDLASSYENKKTRVKTKSRWDAPSSWELTQLESGLGLALGSFAEGSSTSFPVSLLNRIYGNSFMRVDTSYHLYLASYAHYTYYHGDTSGNSYYLGITGYNSAWSNMKNGQNIYFGGGIELTGGSITGPIQSAALSHLTFNPSLKWESNLQGFGKYSIEGSISAVDTVKNHSIWQFQGELKPFEIITKQLAFDAGMKRYKDNWIEFSVGVTWDFAEN